MKLTKFSLLAAIAVPLFAHSAFASSSSPTRSERIPGAVIVDQKDSATEADTENLLLDIQSRFPSASMRHTALESQTKIEVIHVDPADEDALLEYLSGRKGLEGVEPSVLMHAYGLVNLAHPNDPDYDKQWGMKAIDVERAWGASTGRGVTVAVVDTGVDCELSDLAGTNCKNGWNFIDDTDDSTDDQGHGSHCAGTIAQTTNNGEGVAGVAYDAKILAVKVLSAQGSGSNEGVADGIRWAADNGANVISLSLGGPSPSKVVESAVQHALDKGVVVVAANGNDSGPIGYPAGYKGVIAVSATDSTNTIADFSSRGPQTAIGAPGVNILQQTIPGDFKSFSGTSMATPHVAGVAALLVSQGVTNVSAVRERLQSSATKTMKTRLSKESYGAGILNAGQAVADESWHQGFWRFLFILTISTFTLRRSTHKYSWRFMLPAVLAGCGIWFLPTLVAFPSSLTFLASRPLVEITSLFSVKLTSWLPLANALLPGAMMAVLWHRPSARLPIAGVATGIGAYLTQLLWNGSMLLPFGTLASTLVLAGNAAVCIYIASFCLKNLTAKKDPEEGKKHVGKVGPFSLTDKDIDTDNSQI